MMSNHFRGNVEPRMTHFEKITLSDPKKKCTDRHRNYSSKNGKSRNLFSSAE